MVNAYFWDSSALVKRYVVEAGTTWVQAIAHLPARNALIVARITWVEVQSALARRQREGSLTSDQVARAMRTFRYDWNVQYRVVDLDQPLAELAGQLVSRHILRAYDAVQIASALRIEPAFSDSRFTSLTFVAADDRLLSAAEAEGLQTDNPNDHSHPLA
jgi:predicted nucleic acid-binding protein